MDKPFYIYAFGQSDVGMVRKNNEDSLLLSDLTNGVENITSSALNHAGGEKGSLFIVADGMGGAEAGEVASRMAVELVSRNISEKLGAVKIPNRQAFVAALTESVENANLTIHQESHNNQARRGMGTTLTAAGVYDGAIFFAQVGDSRGYLLRNSSIVQMTQDQSLVAQLIASGAIKPEEAKHHPKRNVILQALGVQSKVNVALTFEELRRKDWMLLCSDGLSGKIEAEEMQEVLKNFPEPQSACRKMVAMARERGGEDNITVIVANFDGKQLPQPTREEVAVPRSPSIPKEEVPATQEFRIDKIESGQRRFWPWGKR